MRRTRTSDPEARRLESRFTSAKNAVEAALKARARAREGAVWRTLAAKERLCEDLDRRLYSGEGDADLDAARAQWCELTALPPAWEKAMIGRREAALRALADEGAAAAHKLRIEHGTESRGEMLLELELQCGLDCPPELQVQRRALQLQQLRDRFQGTGKGSATKVSERRWPGVQPGVTDAHDRQRCERVFLAMEEARRD